PAAEKKKQPEGESQLPVRYNQPQKKKKEEQTQGAIQRAYHEMQTRSQAEGEEGRAKGRIGDRLVAMGIITEDQLNVALQEKKISGKMLGAVLVDLGFIDEETLTAFLAESSGFEVFDPKHTIVDGDALALLEKPIAV